LPNPSTRREEKDRSVLNLKWEAMMELLLELLSLMLGVFAGFLGVVWRPETEGGMERFVKGVLPPVLAVIATVLKQ
jgi:hypothetical protein